MAQDIEVPVYNLVSGTFANEVIALDQEIFNQPLRRDIVHKTFEYFEHLGKSVWKRVKTSGDTAGSGKKPTPQKGSGNAR